MALLLAAALALGLSPVGRRLSELPLAALVGAQAFRLPLELVMHQAAAEGTMPEQMSFSGWNFDLATGISAAICGVLLARGKLSRRAVVAWNLLGSLLLATIAAIGISSTPMIRAFGDDPSRVNVWIAHFPFVWLPAVLVCAALLGHVVVARRLLRERDPPRA